jgi:hypothetical protein
MEAPLATVWVRLPVTVILPTVCGCSVDELLFLSAAALLCGFTAAELAGLALLEETALATLLEEIPCGTFGEDVPGCVAAEDNPGFTLGEEIAVCPFAADVPGISGVIGVVGVTVAEDTGIVALDGTRFSVMVLGSILPAAFVASSEQLMNVRTEPRTRTDFRNWCFIVILK